MNKPGCCFDGGESEITTSFDEPGIKSSILKPKKEKKKQKYVDRGDVRKIVAL